MDLRGSNVTIFVYFDHSSRHFTSQVSYLAHHIAGVRLTVPLGKEFPFGLRYTGHSRACCTLWLLLPKEYQERCGKLSGLLLGC